MDLNLNDIDDSKNYEPRLNQEWVQVLIDLRMKYSKLFTRKRNSAADAWKKIFQEMVELGSPPQVTLDKIKKKWMNLIARYKQLKFASNSEITWPYFEQIDRAYSRNPNIVDLRKGNSRLESESDESLVSDYAEHMSKKKNSKSPQNQNNNTLLYVVKKQQFTSTLIQLRHAYRHLFTGKKYAAQKGWLVIQNLLPNGQSYTIEQISKCWQNLMQRYKNLIETEKDHSKISWVHFKTIHEIMSRKDDEAVNKIPTTPPKDIVIKTEPESPEQTRNVIEPENEESEPQQITKHESPKPNQSHNTNNVTDCLEIQLNTTNKRKKRQATTTLNDLLNYFIERDKKIDNYNQEVLKALNNINRLLHK